MINQQAQIVAYNNDFKLMMLTSLPMLFLLLLMRRPRGGGGGGGHAAVMDWYSPSEVLTRLSKPRRGGPTGRAKGAPEDRFRGTPPATGCGRLEAADRSRCWSLPRQVMGGGPSPHDVVRGKWVVTSFWMQQWKSSLLRSRPDGGSAATKVTPICSANRTDRATALRTAEVSSTSP